MSTCTDYWDTLKHLAGSYHLHFRVWWGHLFGRCTANLFPLVSLLPFLARSAALLPAP